ncbi:MAG TPA: cell surface protein SprA [Gemmatimonadales bacterium]|nr:cell surface protein SprA [Gemmatimonadales bacterium]
MRRPASVAVLAALLYTPQAHAQVAADTGRVPGFVATFPSVHLEPPHSPALDPGGRLGPRVRAEFVAAMWAAAIQREFVADSRLGALPAPTPPTVSVGPPPEAPPTFEAAGPTGRLGQFADLGLDMNLRFELKADQFRNLHCTSLEQLQAISGCNGGFPTISPNPQYQIRSSGVVGQRLHINVDFDSQREFDANNQIQLWYEGLEDEVVRRVEAGNVSFQIPGSRFISAAIPTNNFGVQAVAQVAALELRGIYAQQNGNVVRDRTYTIGQTTSQPLDRQARDLDVELGRFFFAIDPKAIPGYPAVDILNLAGLALPPQLQVGALRVYRLRTLATPGANQNIGGIRAVACGATAVARVDCAAQRAGPFQWQILLEGKDYYVDPSGGWLALASRLDQTDYLAVSYVPVGQSVCTSATGCVGTFPGQANEDTSVVDTLRLVYDPRPGITAASPSFRFEIRSAYRVGGQEVDRQSLQLSLMVNQRERTATTGETYLARLGMALANDPTIFDQYNRLFPRDRDPQQGAPVRDYFVIFPHLVPFADTALLAPAERNDSLYRTPRSLLAIQGPPSVFTLVMHASVLASGDRGTLSLNSFQIREGSEKIFLGTTQLQRGSDYTIDYTVGQVVFRNPDSLFGVGGTATIRAQFEERQQFQVTQTSIYGFAGRYDLGTTGAVNFTGLFQRQQSPFTRPPLGLEPASSFIGGVSTDLHFRPQWLTRLADAVPLVHTDAPSFLNVSAEVAVSKPSPNSLGVAYLEEFEAVATRPISLVETSWEFGSLPTSARGATAFGVPASGFDVLDAAALTWQSLPLDFQGRPVQFLPQQIDPQIAVVGQTQSAASVLWFMLKPDTVMGLADSRTGVPNWRRPGSGPNARATTRWRSITQSLSASGLDLSRVEYLDVWVWEDAQRTAKANGAAILFDFGSVFEDAIAFEPDSFTVSPAGDTTYYGGRLAGAGRLDTERDPITHSWSAAINDEGILGDRVTDKIKNATTGEIIDTLPLCSASVNGQLQYYAFGDLRSHCTRHNSSADGEDLDGDFLLDTLAGVRRQEDFVRFVFPIGDERYFVRTGGMLPSPGGGASGWRLYRIPFRTDTLQIGLPNLHQVQSLRITILAPETAPAGQPDPQIYFALSGLNLVGASWLKRADTPIPGIAGEQGTGAGAVIASVVGTVDRDLGYTPPPGVTNQASQAGAALQVSATQINEQSLRIVATGLERGQHAEAYTRFGAEGDKNLLKYRTLRVWARGRGAGWEDHDLEFYFKVGKDADNFYLYHVPARTTSWEPEVVMVLDRWLSLRARIEQAWLRGDPAHVYAGCPDSTIVRNDTAYVMCDGPYIAHIRDPGLAPPNLAAVQELAAGMVRVSASVFIPQAEVWVDDIRLSDVVDDPGVAAALNVSMTAADLLDVAFGVSQRGANFRQLGEDPSYVNDNAVSTAATMHLDRLTPARWGLSAPLTVSFVRTSSAPFFLAGTDVLASSLEGLRTPLSTASTLGLSIRHVRRSLTGVGRWLYDPLSFTASYTSGDSRSSLSEASATTFNGQLDYNFAPGNESVPLHLPLLPAVHLRWSPSALRFHSGLSDATGVLTTYSVPVVDPRDVNLTPARSLQRFWRNSGGFTLTPLPGTQLRLDAGSTRDLRDYGDSSTMGILTHQASQTLLGADIGFESQRDITTYIGASPSGAGWLRPRASLTTAFNLNRDPNGRTPVRDIGDTAGGFHLPVGYANSQRLDLGAQLDLARLGRRMFGDSSGANSVLDLLSVIDVSYLQTTTSTYSRTAAAPSLSYQLGLIGFSALRMQDGTLANAATRTGVTTAATGLSLPLGFRLNVNYQNQNGLSWLLRGVEQVPLTTQTREWPSGTLSWNIAPAHTFLERALSGLTAQLALRQRLTNSNSPGFAGSDASVSRSSTQESSLAPSLTLSWVHGVLTAFDASFTRSEMTQAANVTHDNRKNQNATLSFAWRPPSALFRLKGNIRTTARYSVAQQTTCIQAAGQVACTSYVDSRQSQTQLTMDTSFPPSLSAGLQMAYLINEELQTNRKTSQLVFTAFVQFNAAVGQMR